MSELLSNSARIVLAFIVDNPGFGSAEIARRLGIKHSDAIDALTQLTRHDLVVQHTMPFRHFRSMILVPIQTYYPA